MIQFNASPSIREPFCQLLECVPGLNGIFSREYEGELFWHKGKRISKEFGDAHILPEELEQIFE